jgi:hypothetical protein
MPQSDITAAGEPKWPSMSVDEYAGLEAALGATLVKAGDVWWRKVRPFFYRPLLLHRELALDHLSYPRPSWPGGVQYAVPAGVPANSRIQLLQFDNPRDYSLESLNPTSRRHLRRAMKSFAVRPIPDIEEFIVSGHGVYLSFFRRTRYGYRSDRTDPDTFAQWARVLYRFPKAQVRGAYRGAELVSVSVSYLVEEVAFTATFFSKSEALAEHVSELMLHEIRERAAASGSVELILAAAAGMERGLDEFYLRRGARLAHRPAHLEMNPLALFLLKYFKSDAYSKLGNSL